VFDLSIIRFPEGKKVLTQDGKCIGQIERVYISEFGTYNVVIKTNYPEYPRFEVLMTQLKPEIKKMGSVQEEVYILKKVPIKLQMVMERKKAEGKRVFSPTGEYVGFIERVYTNVAGENIAVIKTVFNELPYFEMPVEKMKAEIREEGGIGEEVYILSNLPIKIVATKQEETTVKTEETREEKSEEKKETILKIAKETQEQ